MTEGDLTSGLSCGLADGALRALGKDDLHRCVEIALDRLLAGMTPAERTELAAHAVKTGLARLLEGLSAEERGNLLDAVIATSLWQVMGENQLNRGRQDDDARSFEHDE